MAKSGAFAPQLLYHDLAQLYCCKSGVFCVCMTIRKHDHTWWNLANNTTTEMSSWSTGTRSGKFVQKITVFDTLPLILCTIQKQSFYNKQRKPYEQWMASDQIAEWCLVSGFKTEFRSILLEVNTLKQKVLISISFTIRNLRLLLQFQSLWSFAWRINISIDSFCIILDWLDEIVKSKSYCCNNVSIVDKLKEWKLYFCTIMKKW